MCSLRHLWELNQKKIERQGRSDAIYFMPSGWQSLNLSQFPLHLPQLFPETGDPWSVLGYGTAIGGILGNEYQNAKVPALPIEQICPNAIWVRDLNSAFPLVNIVLLSYTYFSKQFPTSMFLFTVNANLRGRQGLSLILQVDTKKLIYSVKVQQ